MVAATVKDAQHAHKSDGGSVEGLGDKGGYAILLRNLSAKVGHGLLLFKIQPGDTCTASYHVTQGTLQCILSPRRNCLLHCDIGAKGLQINER
jgi:hypothetical protein